MSDANATVRFLSGTMSRSKLSKPKVFSNDNGTTTESYSIYFDGAFEDTKDIYKGYLNSHYPVNVYESDGEDPVDPSETDGLVFKGRAMVKQIGDRYYLKAVSIEQREETVGSRNPFLDNPLV